jgi:hypothetical protein
MLVGSDFGIDRTCEPTLPSLPRCRDGYSASVQHIPQGAIVMHKLKNLWSLGFVIVGTAYLVYLSALIYHTFAQGWGVYFVAFLQHKRYEPTNCDTHQRIQHHQSNQRQVQGRIGALRRFGPDRVLYPGKSDLRACHHRVGHPSAYQNTKTLELTILALIRENSTKGSTQVDPFNVTECVHAAVKSVHLVCFCLLSENGIYKIYIGCYDAVSGCAHCALSPLEILDYSVHGQCHGGYHRAAEEHNIHWTPDVPWSSFGCR